MRMYRPFTIHNSIVIRFQGYDLDVHNSYELTSIECGLGHCGISILFKKDFDEWVDPNDPRGFVICFEGVTYFAYSFENLAIIPSEIDEIGFKSPNDTDYDWLLTEEQAEPDDHIVFRFINDEILRVFAKNIVVKIEI